MTIPVLWAFQDTDGNPVSLAGKAIAIEAYTDTGATQTGIFRHDTTAGLVVSTSTVTWTPVSGDVATSQVLRYVLWDVIDSEALAKGIIEIEPSRIAVP